MITAASLLKAILIIGIVAGWFFWRRSLKLRALSQKGYSSKKSPQKIENMLDCDKCHAYIPVSGVKLCEEKACPLQ